LVTKDVAMNKLSSIFQNNGRDVARADSQGTPEDKSPPMRDQVAGPAEKALQPVEDARVASLSTMDEKMTFSRAKGLLSQAAVTAANSFVTLLKNQATPADVLRNTLEEVIEYRAADAALTRAAEESALRAICTDTQATTKNLVRLS
jgi:hypothetical protein